MKPFLRIWWPAVAYAAFIFLLSSVPQPIFLGDLDLNDKVKHALLYAVFALLVWRSAVATLALPAAAVLTVLLVSLYGATDEFHQRFVPGRSPDWRDWLADTIAAAFMVTALALWRRQTVSEASGPS